MCQTQRHNKNVFRFMETQIFKVSLQLSCQYIVIISIKSNKCHYSDTCQCHSNNFTHANTKASIHTLGICCWQQSLSAEILHGSIKCWPSLEWSSNLFKPVHWNAFPSVRTMWKHSLKKVKRGYSSNPRLGWTSRASRLNTGAEHVALVAAARPQAWHKL